ncbi:MAG: hypothetical protein AAGC64_07260 [Bacteroidota bacterium]
MNFVMKYTELLTRNLATKEDIHSVEANLLSVEANLLKTTKEDSKDLLKAMNRLVIWFASLLGALATLFTVVIKYLFFLLSISAIINCFV